MQRGPGAHGRRGDRQDAHGGGALHALLPAGQAGALLRGLLARDAHQACARRRQARPGALGDADKKLDRGGPGLGVRMYSREDVELALEGLAEGMSVREVSEMVGCRGSTVRDWAAGRLPRSCTGAPPRGRMAPLPGEGGEGAVTDGERAAYEAAMTVCLIASDLRV